MVQLSNLEPAPSRHESVRFLMLEKRVNLTQNAFPIRVIPDHTIIKKDEMQFKATNQSLYARKSEFTQQTVVRARNNARGARSQNCFRRSIACSN